MTKHVKKILDSRAIKKLMIDNDLNTVSAAEKMKVSPALLGQALRYECQLGLDNLTALAKVLKCSIIDILKN